MKKLLLSIAFVLGLCVSAFAGTGTAADPWTAADLLSGAASGTGWLKGYIVGYIDGQVMESGAVFAATAPEGGTVSATNLMVADAVEGATVATSVPVQLPAGAVRTGLNLKDNPGNLGKEVWLKGTVARYFGVDGGFKTVTEFSFTAPESGEGGGGTTPEPPTTQGDGTEANPYTVADIIAGQTSSAKVWSVGYIVGYIDGKSFNEEGTVFGATAPEGGTVSNTNLVISGSKEGATIENSIAVQLPSAVRAALSLQANPDNLGKEVKLYGTLEAYFGKNGVKNVSDYRIEGSAPVEETYNTLAEWMAGKPSAAATVNAPATAIYQNGNYLYMVSDGTFLLVYGNLSQKYTNGNLIPAGYKGSYTEFHGMAQMVPVAESFAAGAAGAAIQPEVMQCEDLALDMAAQYVQIKGVTIESTDAANTFNITDGTANIVMYNQFNNPANYEVVNVTTGTGLTVTGFVSIRDGVIQIVPTNVANPSGKETVATPTFNPAAGVVAVGTSVEIACATEGASIYYTLDGNAPTTSSTLYTAPIVVNEALTISAIAVKDGMDDSMVATASYTVKQSSDPVGTAATFNFVDPATLSPAQEKPTSETPVYIGGVEFEDNGITFVVDDSGVAQPNSQKARLYLFYTTNESELRAYKQTVLTVSGSAKAMIQKIEFTGAQATTSYMELVGENGTFAGSTYEAASEDGVQSVSFLATARVQISTINVTFKNNAGVEEVEMNDNAPVEYYNLQGVRVNADNLGAGLYIRRQGSKAVKVLVR